VLKLISPKYLYLRAVTTHCLETGVREVAAERGTVYVVEEESAERFSFFGKFYV